MEKDNVVYLFGKTPEKPPEVSEEGKREEWRKKDLEDRKAEYEKKIEAAKKLFPDVQKKLIVLTQFMEKNEVDFTIYVTTKDRVKAVTNAIHLLETRVIAREVITHDNKILYRYPAGHILVLSYSTLVEDLNVMRELGKVNRLFLVVDEKKSNNPTRARFEAILKENCPFHTVIQ